MTKSTTYTPRRFVNGYTVRKGFSVFFQVYSFLWICFFITCLMALIWSVVTCSATVSGGSAVITFGTLPQALSYFMPINIGWDGGFTYSFNAMSYLNIVFLALELIYIVIEIFLVLSFKSPQKVSEKSIEIIQSSLIQRPHKIIAHSVSAKKH